MIQKWKPTDRCAERGHRRFAGRDGRGATQQQRFPRYGFQRPAEVFAIGNVGSQTVLSKLAKLPSVEIVHHYLTTLPESQAGSLAGLSDVRVSQAMLLLHIRLA